MLGAEQILFYSIYSLKSLLWKLDSPCCFILYIIKRIDREQIRSRINNNDCRTFRPRRPLSTAYRTKETAV